MQFKNSILICFIGAISFLFSCSQEKEKDIPVDLIEKSVFINLLLEMQLVETHINEVRVEQVYIRDSANNFFKEIFEKYDCTLSEFRKTMDYYSTEPGELQAMYEIVLDKLSEMEADLVDIKLGESIMTILGKHDVAHFISKLPLAQMYFDSTFSGAQIKDSLFKFLINNPTSLDTLNVNVASFQKSYIGLTYKKPRYLSLREEIKAIVTRNKKLLQR